MNTIPSPIQRKALKRTFLREVTAKVTFAETNFSVNDEAIQSFLKDRFGITDLMDLSTLGAIDITSEGKDESYRFSTTSAEIRIDSRIYRFFDDSLLPRLEVLVTFLQSLGVEDILTFSITKKNLFQATANDSYNAWKVALIESFKSDNIRQLANTLPSPSNPFKMSLDGKEETEWGELKVPFTIEIPDNNVFRFFMDLEAISKSLNSSKLIERGERMNEEIFNTFTHIISDKLLLLMQQD